jgi:hypothetical protein
MGRRGPLPMSMELQALRGFPSKRKPRAQLPPVVLPTSARERRFKGLICGLDFDGDIPPCERWGPNGKATKQIKEGWTPDD